MRKIPAEKIVSALEKAVIDANTSIDADISAMLRFAVRNEEDPLASEVLKILTENSKIALNRKTPLCQDTGIGIVFVTIGSRVTIEGMSIKKAINKGIENGYKNGFLRKSVVSSPFKRSNTGTNTPAIIHFDYDEGDKLIIDFLAKGGGCENKSALKMLKPSDGINGMKKFVLDTIEQAGASACPPFFVGIGIGGNFEMCAYLAKKALIRKVGEFSKIDHIKAIEVELLDEINKLSIGPMGFGGNTTAFSVAIEEAPCHIASLPVAVNIDCHSHRHKRLEF